MSTNLMQASHQWRTRPSDERFASLTELHHHCETQNARSTGRVISSRALVVQPAQNDESHQGLVVIGPNGSPANFSHWSFSQLANRAGAPAGYLRDLPAPLTADCLNYGLKFNRQPEDVGVLLYKNGDTILRACTGPNYGRIWNTQAPRNVPGGLSHHCPDEPPGRSRVTPSNGDDSMTTHYNYLDMLTAMKRIDKNLRCRNPREYYIELAGMMTKVKDMAGVIACATETNWYHLGKPYFKLWPHITSSIAYSRVDIPGRFLQLPYPVYEVRLPQDQPLLELAGAPPLRAMLVSCLSNKLLDEKKWERAKLDQRLWGLFVHYQFDTDDFDSGHGWHFGMGVYKDEPLEQTIEETWERTGGHKNEANCKYTPSFEMCQAIMRIAIATAFFGTDRHELVCPDIPRRLEERWRKARELKDQDEEKTILDEAKQDRMGGYKVGHELDLPRPKIVYHGEPQPTGKHYEHQHASYRRGHLRMQPYGPKDNPTKYELIFVSPSVVRPDLPFREQHGFRIKGDE